MANPVIVSLTADTWELAVENVAIGQIKRLSKNPNLYLETYRMTGDPKPTDQNEGLPIFIGSNSEIISASAAIDVYIMAVGVDGKIRVDR